MEYSGAGGKLIHEINQKQKSRDTVPLNKQNNFRLKTVKIRSKKWRNFLSSPIAVLMSPRKMSSLLSPQLETPAKHKDS